MEDDKSSVVNRLVQCFERGVAQRLQNQRRDITVQSTPAKLPSCNPNPSTSDGLSSSEVEMRTPQTSIQFLSRLNAAVGEGAEKFPPGTGGKQISPGVFYGSPLGKPSNKPLHVLRLLNEIQNDLGQNHSRDVESPGAFKPASATRAAIWATFPKQEQAIQFAESNLESGVAVFQYQDHMNGQRRFLATTYDEFWQRYRTMSPEHRHHYEIIQEGKPCHLYFDLEFSCRANPQADGEAMVDILLGLVQKIFSEVYALDYNHSWTVELDSSTKEKFSRHVIIRVPGAAFRDNLNVGRFVSEICRRVHHQCEDNEDLNRLFVLKGESLASHHTELFVDQAVYSRNRSFRLPFSSKAGKVAKLLPTSRFRSVDLEEERDLFMDSLICRVEDKCDRLLTFGSEGASRGGMMNYATWKDNPSFPSKRSGSAMSGRSPFPALDVFVESVACIGNIPGRIRSWYWFSEYGVVVYNISDNRFCENIGRPHKSNNVMYIVDFRTAGYYQKCHDPDCRGYRSPLRPIPGHTIPPEYCQPSFPRCERSGDAIIMDGRQQIRLFEGESEDEHWWEEVASSVAFLESQTQQSQRNKDASVCNTEVDSTEDDDWWTAVLPELAALEHCMITQSK